MENTTLSSKVQKVSNFLKDAGIFYLLTTANSHPKGRPFGFHMVENDTLYFATVTFKNVYKQMQKNPFVEIIATKNESFIRYDGTAVFSNNEKLIKMVLEIMPEIGELYKNRSDFELTVFHLQNGTVEIRNMTEIIETFEI